MLSLKKIVCFLIFFSGCKSVAILVLVNLLKHFVWCPCLGFCYIACATLVGWKLWWCGEREGENGE